MSILVLRKFTPLGFESRDDLGDITLPWGRKFTPLGFESTTSAQIWRWRFCVNLPRWGLKGAVSKKLDGAGKERKFTPLGFER